MCFFLFVLNDKKKFVGFDPMAYLMQIISTSINYILYHI
jgi:hypothetical protein